jgi:hypothetical protein
VLEVQPESLHQRVGFIFGSSEEVERISHRGLSPRRATGDHRLHDSFMSRANTLVVPSGKMELAMQLIYTPMI